MSETFHFSDLKGLRDFLDGFKKTDLSTIWPDESSDYIELKLSERELSDGSKVTDVTIRMV